MTTFVALYHGSTVAEAQLINVSADTELVKAVVDYFAGSAAESSVVSNDPVICAIETGKRKALGIIQGALNEEVSNE